MWIVDPVKWYLSPNLITVQNLVALPYISDVPSLVKLGQTA